MVYTLTKLPVAQRTEGSGSPSAGCSPDPLNQPFFPVPELVCQVLQHFRFGALTGRLRTRPVQPSSEDTEPPSGTCRLPPCRALPPRLPGFQGSSSSCPVLFPVGAGPAGLHPWGPGGATELLSLNSLPSTSLTKLSAGFDDIKHAQY